MLNSTETLLDNHYGDKIFTDQDLFRVFDGSSARRYGLVNKALKKGEWLRLHRGVYILNQKYRTKMVGKYFIAGNMVHGSYISLESALSYHNLIPERVEMVTCVTFSGRTRFIKNKLGGFKYLKIPVNKYEFLTGVERAEIDGKAFLIATPLRAIADYVYEKKIKWSGIDFLIENLRIEEEELLNIPGQQFDDLMLVYSTKRVLHFLEKLRETLKK